MTDEFLCACRRETISTRQALQDSSLFFSQELRVDRFHLCGVALPLSSCCCVPLFSKEASMRKPHVIIVGALLAVAALPSGLCSAVAQETSSNGVPVHVVVTVEPRHGSNVPVINREDV